MKYKLNLRGKELRLGLGLAILFKKFPVEQAYKVTLDELFGKEFLQPYLEYSISNHTNILVDIEDLSEELFKSMASWMASWLSSIILTFSLTNTRGNGYTLLAFLDSIFGGIYICIFYPRLTSQLGKDFPDIPQSSSILMKSIPMSGTSWAKPPEIIKNALHFRLNEESSINILPLKHFKLNPRFYAVLGTRIPLYGGDHPCTSFQTIPDNPKVKEKIFFDPYGITFKFNPETTDFGLRSLLFKPPKEFSIEEIKATLNKGGY